MLGLSLSEVKPSFFLGDHEGTIADCDQALKLNPKYADAFCARGHSKCALGDDEGAIADCNQALKLDPKHAGAEL